MSIALHSGQLAAGFCLAGGSAASHPYHRELERQLAGQVRLASALYGLGRLSAGRSLLVGASRAMPALIGVATSLTRIRKPARVPLPIEAARHRRPPALHQEVV